MPQGVYSNFKCTEKHGPFTPQVHQTFVKNYFLETPYKGLLLYHRLGSGKSCSSIIIGDALLKLKNIDTVYVMAPGALRQGWIKEYCGVCGAKAKWLTDHYTFVTYNYNVAAYLPKTFDNSLVIIDEVHNLINGVKNQAKNVTAIYAKLMTSNCKILTLSGTPIYNNIYEWPLLGNLLKPGAFPPIIVGGNLVPEKFMNLFNISNDGVLTPKNPSAFNKALQGIISYFPGLGGGLYPQLVEEPVIKVEMTPDQENKYWTAYNTEETFLGFGMPDPKLKYKDPKKYEWLKQMYVMSKKRIMSRQPSNFYYPELVYDKYPERPKDAVYPDGWVKKKYFADGQLLKSYSTKMAALFNNILDNFHSKHMVFTFFKEHSGVNIMKAILEMCGLRTETFSGDLSDIGRRKLLNEFNSVKNRYGDQIKVLFVTDAGAEGITLLETGHVHILESDPRENKIQQAIGRVVRYKSHINMPKAEQVVHLWRYWSMSSHKTGEKLEIKWETTTPSGEIVEQTKEVTVKEATIDEILYKEGQIKMNTFNSFLQLLIDASIEN